MQHNLAACLSSQGCGSLFASQRNTIVREYVAETTSRSRDMFVPLRHRPGHAQADFGEADDHIAGRKMRSHYFCINLPHSDG
jgi:hypothetical protein